MIDPFLIKKTREHFDAIVVGSGISGGWVAKTLCEKGLKVLMLERGRPVHHRQDYPTEGKAPWEFEHRGQVKQVLIDEQHATQKKCYAFNDATKHFFGNDRDLPYQTAEGSNFDWIRGNQLGGKSLTWHRQVYRMGPVDFEENLRDGHGIDWPIRYEDLAPWYSLVENFIGVSGSRDNIASLPDSEVLPAFGMNALEKHAKKVIESRFKNRKLIHGRCAHLSQPTQFFLDQGRAKCMARDQCQRGCSFGAYFSTLSSTLPAALKTGNLKIACHSVVDHLIYNDKTNRVTGVQVIDEQNFESREYRANMVFLCASTLATTQIMLNSTSAQFPNGIANSSGVLGHYLMDHIYNSYAVGNIDGFEDAYYKGNRPAGLIIPRWQNLKTQDEKFKRGYFLRCASRRDSVFHGINSDEFGLEFKNDLRAPGPWRFYAGGSGEMLPNYDNHVRLHPEKKDKWGMPQLLIDCRWSENDKLMMTAMKEACEEILESLGAKNIRSGISDAPPGLTIHEMGTARMGKDPQSSVLNAYNQCHDVPNLYVTDGACMSSSAHQNPSLTYMAISARAATRAADQYKGKA